MEHPYLILLRNQVLKILELWQVLVLNNKKILITILKEYILQEQIDCWKWKIQTNEVDLQ